MPFSDAAKSLLTSKTFYSGLLAIVTGVTTIVAGKDIDIPSRIGLTADQITTLGVTLGPLLYTLGSTAIVSGVGAIFGRIVAHRPISFPGTSPPPAATPMREAEGDLARMTVDRAAMAAQRERVRTAVGAMGAGKEGTAGEVMGRPAPKGPSVSPFSGNLSVSIVIVAASGLAVAGCTIPVTFPSPSFSDLAAACAAFDDALDEATAAVLAGRLAGPGLMRAGALKQEATAKCQVPASMTPADVAVVRADTQRLRALLPAGVQ